MYISQPCARRAHRNPPSDIYRVSLKKGTFLILFLFLFQKSDFTFSHVFWNQNFNPVSSSHSNNTHSESELPQKRMHTCNLLGWMIIEIIIKVNLVEKTDCTNASLKANRPASDSKMKNRIMWAFFLQKRWGESPNSHNL